MAQWIADAYVFPRPAAPRYAADDARVHWIDHARPIVVHEAPHSKWAVVYVHGNAEDAGSRVGEALRDMLAECSVFVPEYPGYGHAPGRPSADGIHAAVEDALHYVRSRGYDEAHTLVVGYSLGSGAAIRAATDRPHLAGLALLEAFTTLREVARTYAPRAGCFAGMVPVYYDNLRWIRRVRCPTLLVHHCDDPLIPLSHAEALRDARGRGCELLALARDRHALDLDLVRSAVAPKLKAMLACTASHPRQRTRTHRRCPSRLNSATCSCRMSGRSRTGPWFPGTRARGQTRPVGGFGRGCGPPRGR